MLEAGRKTYENISIPEEKLLAAIGKGIRREKQDQRRRVIRNFTAAAAACFALLFGCANVPSIYAYASDVPVLKTFVQAFRIGRGGQDLEGAEIYVESDRKSITVSFLKDGKAADRVMGYSIAYQEEPARLQVTFEGLGEKEYEILKKNIENVEAVAEVYQEESRKKKELTIVMVLKESYNYESMEFSDPGSLTIHFYQDAYFTEEERP